MDEVRRSERLQIVLSPEEKAMLEELAEANTGENSSMMVRKLIALAWEQHKTMGLHAPKVFPLVTQEAGL